LRETERQLLVDLDIMSMLMNVALPSGRQYLEAEALRTETLVHQARLACALETLLPPDA